MIVPTNASAARHGPHDDEGLGAIDDLVGQWCVGGFVRQILLAREEANVGTPTLGLRIANRASQHGMTPLEGVENRSLRHGTGDVEQDFAILIDERLQVRGQHDSDHAKVCTSTDSTAGRSRTIAVHESPASFDA